MHPNHTGYNRKKCKPKSQKSLFFHHLLQISDESSEVDFDVIKHTKLLGAVLSSAFFPYLIKVGGGGGDVRHVHIK